MIFHYTCIMQIDYELLAFEISKQKTWIIFKRSFILIYDMYWIRDYIHLKIAGC